MLNELAKEINKIAVEHGFWDEGKKRDPARILMLIVSEAVEVFEEIRNGQAVDYTYYREDGKPEGVPTEMADIIIRVLDACYVWGIDIDATVKEKMAYNDTRPYMHGKIM